MMGPHGDKRGIIRLDQPTTGTYGWQVRIQREGVKYARYFSDRGHGGAGCAFQCARAWRDELLAGFADDERARVCRPSERNSSGVVGVSRITVQVSGRGGYHFWQASWSPETGVRRSIRFSILRYGEREAFALAVKARHEGTGF